MRMMMMVMVMIMMMMTMLKMLMLMSRLRQTGWPCSVLRGTLQTWSAGDWGAVLGDLSPVTDDWRLMWCAAQ